jgi:hypothetical protein
MNIKMRKGHLVGKYNGQQITGFQIKFIFDYECWHWFPRLTLKYTQSFFWLWFRVFWEYEYGKYIEEEKQENE